MDNSRLQEVKDAYLKDGLDALLKEKDWEYLQVFNDNWDINAADFKDMIDRSIKSIKNFAGLGANAFSTIGMISDSYPNKIKDAFRDLFDETSPLTTDQKVNNFRNAIKNDTDIQTLLETRGIADTGKAYTFAQSNTSVMSYLWLKYPNKYYQYALKVQKEAYNYLNPGHEFPESKHLDTRLANVKTFMDELRAELNSDTTFMDKVKDKLDEKGYDVNNTKVINHFAFWAYNIAKDKKASTEGNEPLEDEVTETEKNEAVFKGINVSETLNIILYGPPGTSKTYSTKKLAVLMCDGVAPEDYRDICKRYKELVNDNRVKFITFHQSYSYEEFIGGMKADAKGGVVNYFFEDGVFKKFCDDNRRKSEKCVFIIDEINRGNIAKIFGELITLIETTKREGMTEEASAILPYNKESFTIPSNISLIGTMNTADKSITQLDTALRRRFDFIEMMPNYDLLDGIDSDNDEISIKDMLMTMNKRIELLYDREHQIGHSYFMDLAPGFTLEELNQVFFKRIIPLLKEYFYDDYYKIQLVLGEFKEKNPINFIIKDNYSTDIFGKNADIDDLVGSTYHVNSMKNVTYDSYAMIYKTITPKSETTVEETLQEQPIEDKSI